MTFLLNDQRFKNRYGKILTFAHIIMLCGLVYIMISVFVDIRELQKTYGSVPALECGIAVLVVTNVNAISAHALRQLVKEI